MSDLISPPLNTSLVPEKVSYQWDGVTWQQLYSVQLCVMQYALLNGTFNNFTVINDLLPYQTAPDGSLINITQVDTTRPRTITVSNEVWYILPYNILNQPLPYYRPLSCTVLTTAFFLANAPLNNAIAPQETKDIFLALRILHPGSCAQPSSLLSFVIGSEIYYNDTGIAQSVFTMTLSNTECELQSVTCPDQTIMMTSGDILTSIPVEDNIALIESRACDSTVNPSVTSPALAAYCDAFDHIDYSDPQTNVVRPTFCQLVDTVTRPSWCARPTNAWMIFQVSVKNTQPQQGGTSINSLDGAKITVKSLIPKT